MKIIQYCQHVLGIGHLFRSLEIARALSAHEVILVTGGPPVETDLPEHVREFRLPDLQMDQNFKGLFSTAQDLTIEQVKEERQKQLLALFENEKPELFLVELYPFGRKAFRFELEPVLKALREKRLGPCRVISSVRDILVEKDDHGKHEARVVKTLNRYFDGVLVHGDPDLVEIRETFAPFDEIEIPVEYTGYIAPRPLPDTGSRLRQNLGVTDRDKLILASAGGGNVGAPLLSSVIQAFSHLANKNCRLQVFSGPFLSPNEFDRLKELAGQNAQVDRFTADFGSWLAAADLSVSMGGYNTTMNLLAARVPALLWPFSQNREQRLRAQRLAERGLLTVLQDTDLQPERLAAMMEHMLSQSTRPTATINLDGAATTAACIEDWVTKHGVGLMQPNVPAIWRRLPPDLGSRIEECIRTGCEKAEDRGVVYLFFRADDVAVPGKQFSLMMDLFSIHGAPLSLAVVPAWLTRQRWQYLKGFEKKNPSGWCWHQHGWRHANHEPEGKKQEFGDARAVSEIRQDLERGKHRLKQLMEDRFYPVFTPPWNRCGSGTLQLLKGLGYAAVSRSRGSKPPPPPGLPDYCVNVDLHTRKEKNPAAGWENLLAELHQALATNYCGIMIHHQMMNAAAFDFLKVLLRALKKNPKLQLTHFKDLAGKKIF